MRITSFYNGSFLPLGKVALFLDGEAVGIYKDTVAAQNAAYRIMKRG